MICRFNQILIILTCATLCCCKVQDDFSLRTATGDLNPNAPDGGGGDEESEITYPTLYYVGSGSWYESSYKEFRIQSVKTTVTPSASDINIKLNNINVQNNNSDYESEAKPYVPTSKDATFTRASVTKLESLQKKNSGYKEKSWIMFGTKSKEKITTPNGGQQTLNYTFTNPLPVVIMPAQKATYNSALKDEDLTFESNLSGHRDVSISTTVSLVSADDNIVTIKVFNNITSYGDSASGVRREEVYSALPFSREYTYTVDTDKQEIMKIDSISELLVSRYLKDDIGKARSVGNKADLNAHVELCKTDTDGEVKTFKSCN